MTIPGGYAFRSLFFDPNVYPGLPAQPCVLDVNPLRELILRIVAWPADAPLDAARARIVDTLLDEFAAAPSRPMPCRCRPTAGCAPSRPNC